MGNLWWAVLGLKIKELFWGDDFDSHVVLDCNEGLVPGYDEFSFQLKVLAYSC